MHGEFLLEFLEWKKNLERETSFFIESGVNHEKKITYYDCNRSGSYASTSKERHTRIQGSRKMNGKCPSVMILTEDTELTVRFVRTHFGHEIELKHVDIPKEDKNMIAEFIKFGLPKHKILERIRSSWTEENMIGIHFTSQKDIANIARAFNLNSDVIRHKNDSISLESFVDEMTSSPDDPILHYQQPQEDGSSDFFLAIMTKGQRYMIEKYSDSRGPMQRVGHSPSSKQT